MIVASMEVVWALSRLVTLSCQQVFCMEQELYKWNILNYMMYTSSLVHNQVQCWFNTHVKMARCLPGFDDPMVLLSYDLL